MNILFICTGNTCRSPMAAMLMRRTLDKRGRSDIMVDSAGLAAHGEPVSANAVAAIKELDDELGMLLSKHISRRVTSEMLRQADCIAVMSQNHALSVIRLGADSDKVCVLSAGEQTGIADPYGGSLETYRLTRNQLEQAVNALADELLKGKDDGRTQ